MGRFAQNPGKRGSLKWIQRAVNERPDLLDGEILKRLAPANSIEWLSPLAAHKYAEYRDADFLELIGKDGLAPKLARFWPARGPQWDAIGKSDKGDVLLVEAKAHIPELCSPATQASPKSRKMIERAMKATIETCRAQPRAAWTDVFYQLANRLAHLKFLRDAKVRAWLVLVNFIGDEDMKGPRTQAEWEAAYAVAFHVMGLDKRNPLSKYIIHVYPDVRELGPKANTRTENPLSAQLEAGRAFARDYAETLKALGK
jgi:hypothetical protein